VLRTPRFRTIASVAALSLASAAQAQVVAPVAPTQAFDAAVAEGCVPVIAQRLSLNAPSEALARASLRTHQPNAVEQAAFADFSAETRAFASRPATGGATVVLGEDAARGVCRVALFGAPERDLSATRSYLEALVRTLTRARVQPNLTEYSGSIDGSPRLRLAVETPPPLAGPLSGPQLILTFAREGA